MNPPAPVTKIRFVAFMELPSLCPTGGATTFRPNPAGKEHSSVSMPPADTLGVPLVYRPPRKIAGRAGRKGHRLQVSHHPGIRTLAELLLLLYKNPTSNPPSPG